MESIEIPTYAGTVINRNYVNNYGVTDRQHSTVNPNVKVIEVTPE